MRIETVHPAATTLHTRRGRRLFQGVAFVTVWIGLGALLPIGQIGYLFLGIPIAAGFQLAVRRRPLRELWARGGGRVAPDHRDNAMYAALTLLVALAFVARGATDEAWNDTIWITGVMAIAIVVGYVVLRRTFVAFALGAVLVAATGWMLTPHLASQRSGDPQLLAQLARFEGYQDLSVAVVDLNAPQQVRFANTGSTNRTRFEVASATKALTGLVIADASMRGEVNLASPVSIYLPLKGSPAGDVTMRQLVTHTSGYPRDSAATAWRALWTMPFGLNPDSESMDQTMQEIRGAALSDRGSYAYSNLGAAAAGQATAAAVGMSYPELMRTRLFEPMRMADTAVQTSPMVAGGKGAAGRPVQPWVMDGLAPAGGVVSTSKDLSSLATAILNGTAPGLNALTGSTATDGQDERIGIFWFTNRTQDGQTITEHGGMNGGYTSYLGFDLKNKKAVIVLSDVSKDVHEIGMHLLSHGS